MAYSLAYRALHPHAKACVHGIEANLSARPRTRCFLVRMQWSYDAMHCDAYWSAMSIGLLAARRLRSRGNLSRYTAIFASVGAADAADPAHRPWAAENFDRDEFFVPVCTEIHVLQGLVTCQIAYNSLQIDYGLHDEQSKCLMRLLKF